MIDNNIYLCINCNKPHSGDYHKSLKSKKNRNNIRFCSKKCSRTFSTKKINFNEQKIINCSVCHHDAQINKKDNILICYSCRVYKNKYNKNNKNKPAKICTFCGAFVHDCATPDICNKLRTIPSLIKFVGFDKSTIGSKDAIKEYERAVKILTSEYNTESTASLAKKYNVKIGTMYNFLRSIDINFRTHEEATTLAYSQNKMTGIIRGSRQYKCGWHTTWEGTQVYYRSSYELLYAKKLDLLNISYNMECNHIKYWDSQKEKYRTAIPDFYLPASNELIEIKSSYTYDPINMLDKFKYYIKNGFKPSLILDHKIHDVFTTDPFEFTPSKI